MPRGNLVSKREVGNAIAKSSPVSKRRGRPPKSESVGKIGRKQSIAKVTKTAKPAPKIVTAERPHQPAIAITVQIPSLRRPKSSATTQAVKPSLPKRKLVPLVVSALVLAAGVVGALAFVPKHRAAPIAGGVADAASRTTPDYQPLMLADQKPMQQSFDGRRDSVQFTTSFSGIRVTVSEQALPANFTRDPTALLRAADSLNAKQRIDTAKGPLFIATNDTAGDQMGIFADSQVLGFIHTDHKMDDVSWKSFVEQLKTVNWQATNQQAGN